MGEVEAQAEGHCPGNGGRDLARHAGEGPVRKAGSRDRHDDRCGES